MSRRTTEGRALALALAATLLGSSAASDGRPDQATPPSMSETRGKALYLTGESPSGTAVTAFFGEGQLELPGRSATCGSCHGSDGKGRPESGVVPTNVTWSYLTKTYGHVHRNGVEHPPFDEPSLAGYLATGVYPGGQRGDPAMPRYEMSARDLEDLIAYLKRLGQEQDPGLTGSAIRIGTLVPDGGRLGAIGTTIERALDAYFRDMNEGGGIYGRRVAFVAHRVPPDGRQALASVEAWLAQEEPFALVGSFTPGIDREVQAILAGRGLPLIGPFTLWPVTSYALNRHVFYLHAGLAEQVQALLRFVAERSQTVPRLALVHPDDSSLDDVVQATRRACEASTWPAPLPQPYSRALPDAPASVRRLRDGGIDLVVHLGMEPEIRAFLDAADAEGWTPRVLASGALAGSLVGDAPAAFRGRLYLAYPTLPQDRKPWATEKLSRLLATPGPGMTHVQAAASSLGAAELAVEALRRSGRSLSRDSLFRALERMHAFETGLTPPVTYTPNRRMGAGGAYVVEFDPVGHDAAGQPRNPVWVEVQ